MTLPELAIRRHVTTLMLLVSMVVLGAVALAQLPLAFMPDFELPSCSSSCPTRTPRPSRSSARWCGRSRRRSARVKGLRNMCSRCDAGRRHGAPGVRLGHEHAGGPHRGLGEDRPHPQRTARRHRARSSSARAGTGGEARSPIIEGRLVQQARPERELRPARPADRQAARAHSRRGQRPPGRGATRAKCASTCAWPTSSGTASTSATVIAGRCSSGNFDQSPGQDHRAGESRYALRTVGHVRQRGARSATAAHPRATACACATWPTSSTRSRRSSTAATWTASSPSASPSPRRRRPTRSRSATRSRRGSRRWTSDPELEGVNFLVWFSQGKEIRKTLGDLTLHRHLRRPPGVAWSCSCSCAASPRRSLRRCASPSRCIVACGVIWAQGQDAQHADPARPHRRGRHAGGQRGRGDGEHLPPPRGGADRARRRARRGSREVALAVTAATLTSVIVFLPMIFNKPSEMNIYLKELGDHRLPDAARLAVRQPDPDPAGHVAGSSSRSRGRAAG